MENPVSELLAKLTEQQELLARQKRDIEETENVSRSSSATNPYDTTTPTETATSDGRPDAAEVYRLKKELELAQERMAQMDLQLTQSRLAQHTMEEAIGSPFPGAQHLAANLSGQTIMAPIGTAPQVGGNGRTASPLERVNYNLTQHP